MKYKRNWAWECLADVIFNDGTECVAECQTDNKGRLNYIRIDGKSYAVNDAILDLLDIREIHFTTPAKVIRNDNDKGFKVDRKNGVIHLL